MVSIARGAATALLLTTCLLSDSAAHAGTILNYEERDTIPRPQYLEIEPQIVGDGAIAIAEDHFRTFVYLDALPDSGLTISGSVTALRPTRDFIDPIFPTFAESGVYAGMSLGVSLIAPASSSGADLFNAPVLASAGARVDDGVAGPGTTAVGPYFSVTFTAAEIATAVAAAPAGAPLAIAFSGSVYSEYGSGGIGDLDFTITAVPEAASVVSCGTAAAVLGGLAWRRRRTRGRSRPGERSSS